MDSTIGSTSEADSQGRDRCSSALHALQPLKGSPTTWGASECDEIQVGCAGRAANRNAAAPFSCRPQWPCRLGWAAIDQQKASAPDPRAHASAALGSLPLGHRSADPSRSRLVDGGQGWGTGTTPWPRLGARSSRSSGPRTGSAHRRRAGQLGGSRTHLAAPAGSLSRSTRLRLGPVGSRPKHPPSSPGAAPAATRPPSSADLGGRGWGTNSCATIKGPCTWPAGMHVGQGLWS